MAEKCPGCTFPGIHFPAHPGCEESSAWPSGYQAVERCDDTQAFPDDLSAALWLQNHHAELRILGITRIEPGCGGSHVAILRAPAGDVLNGATTGVTT